MSEGQIAFALDALQAHETMDAVMYPAVSEETRAETQAAVALNQADIHSLMYPAASEETRAAVAAFPWGTPRSKTLCWRAQRAQMTWAPRKAGTRRGSGNHEPKKLFPNHTI